MYDNWYVIANSFSDSGKTKKSIPKIEKALIKKGVNYKISLTEKAGDEIKMVANATRLGYNKILGIGGDGTAQKIVAGDRKSVCRERV